jgi:hypothetical protein
MPKLVVGVERVPESFAALGLHAHAVPDLGEATGLGVALCSVPAHVLTLVPDLEWDDVDLRHRCPLCQAAWRAYAGGAE